MGWAGGPGEWRYRSGAGPISGVGWPSAASQAWLFVSAAATPRDCGCRPARRWSGDVGLPAKAREGGSAAFLAGGLSSSTRTDCASIASRISFCFDSESRNAMRSIATVPSELFCTCFSRASACARSRSATASASRAAAASGCNSNSGRAGVYPAPARRARAAAASIPCEAARAVSSATRTRSSISPTTCTRAASATRAAPSACRSSARNTRTSAPSLFTASSLFTAPPCTPAAPTPRVSGVACGPPRTSTAAEDRSVPQSTLGVDAILGSMFGAGSILGVRNGPPRDVLRPVALAAAACCTACCSVACCSNLRLSMPMSLTPCWHCDSNSATRCRSAAASASASTASASP
mmetsp:Transcript_20370/g.66075  ORF Transcript_20370/g.66075 Transcript_20370/m.66075 type:complete len:351 (-) Transcript_20370:87-1139(-)